MPEIQDTFLGGLLMIGRSIRNAWLPAKTAAATQAAKMQDRLADFRQLVEKSTDERTWKELWDLPEDLQTKAAVLFFATELSRSTGYNSSLTRVLNMHEDWYPILLPLLREHCVKFAKLKEGNYVAALMNQPLAGDELRQIHDALLKDAIKHHDLKTAKEEIDALKRDFDRTELEPLRKHFVLYGKVDSAIEVAELMEERLSAHERSIMDAYNAK